jgi:hypothetical protein
MNATIVLDPLDDACPIPKEDYPWVEQPRSAAMFLGVALVIASIAVMKLGMTSVIDRVWYCSPTSLY